MCGTYHYNRSKQYDNEECSFRHLQAKGKKSDRYLLDFLFFNILIFIKGKK